MHLCINARIDVHVCTDVCFYHDKNVSCVHKKSVYMCTDVYTYVCMYACMHVRMYTKNKDRAAAEMKDGSKPDSYHLPRQKK